jgi:hypothetical protein
VSPARREVLATVGLALLLLPLCLAAWYFAADAIGWVPARLAAPVISSAAGKATPVEAGPRQVAYAVDVVGPYRPGGAQRAEARVEVHAATYTFGIAIFVALALAVRGWRRPARLGLGVAILLPLPAFGIACDALLQLASSPQLGALLAWSGGTREAIVLGYQLGSLLLPTLAPIVAWLALFPEAWRRPTEVNFSST